MSIEHVIICGGGTNAFSSLGIIHEAMKDGVIQYDKLKTIYAVSSGSFVGLILALKPNIEDVVEYLLNFYFLLEKHQALFKSTSTLIATILKNKGIFDNEFIRYIIKPLLEATDVLNIESTLSDLYEYSNIHLNILTTDLNAMQTEHLNHETHPNLKIYEAIHMSCSIPIVLNPIKINGNFYIDGALYTNNPIEYCIDKEAATLDKILAITSVGSIGSSNKNIINDENVIFYVGSVLRKIIFSFGKDELYKTVKSKYFFGIKGGVDETIIKIKDPQVRKEIYNTGVECYHETISRYTLLNEPDEPNETDD